MCFEYIPELFFHPKIHPLVPLRFSSKKYIFHQKVISTMGNKFYGCEMKVKHEIADDWTIKTVVPWKIYFLEENPEGDQGVNFRMKKKVQEYIRNTYSSTQLSMLIPNMLLILTESVYMPHKKLRNWAKNRIFHDFSHKMP